MEETTKNKKKNDDSKKKERHIVTWSQQVSLSIYILMKSLFDCSVVWSNSFWDMSLSEFFRRRMIYFESKSVYMELTSSFFFLSFSSSSVSLVVLFDWFWLKDEFSFFDVLIGFSWAIIASNFTDKSTRQCRRRFVVFEIKNDLFYSIIMSFGFADGIHT